MKNTVKALLLLIVVLLNYTGLSQFTEPKNLIYGTITGNGQQVTRNDTQIVIELRKSAESDVLASYTMGDEASLADFYRLNVMLMNDDGARTLDDLVVGDKVWVVVRDATNDLTSVSYVIEERGRPVRLDLTFTGSCTDSRAGEDGVICGDSTVLAANTPEIGTGSWSIIEGAGGTINDPASPTSQFSGIRGISYVLQWDIQHDIYLDTMDQVTILFVNETTADAGSDLVMCNTMSQLAGNSPGFGGGQWTIESGQNGILEDATHPDSLFYGREGETYILRWTLDNGQCPESSDTAQYRFLHTPNAGANQFVCGTSTLLDALQIQGAIGHWEIVSGFGGSFVDSGDPKTKFFGSEGITYILNWIYEGSDCRKTDQVQIIFSGLTCGIFVEKSVMCAPDMEHQLFSQVRCGSTPYSYLWRVVDAPAAGGMFSDITAANPIFTPFSDGKFVFELEVTDDSGKITTASLDVFVPITDVDGNPGVTHADFLFRVSNWSSSPCPRPLDVNSDDRLDVIDLILVLPCHQD